jgi:enamine deaminase RidA (YjgF/YER057c/UK114 family)
MSADVRFNAEAAELGYDFDGEIKIGGNYMPIVRDREHAYVSGQIPRVGDQVLFVGAVGAEIDLQAAKTAAKICAMRSLALIQRAIGSLDLICAIPRITVYVRSTSNFTQQSEVADAASDLLLRVLGSIGAHSRTSVGVLQLPKGASVEIDLVASIKEVASSAA